MSKHLCKSCIYSFETCRPERLLFGGDLDEKARGAEADIVLECSNYTPYIRFPLIAILVGLIIIWLLSGCSTKSEPPPPIPVDIEGHSPWEVVIHKRDLS